MPLLLPFISSKKTRVFMDLSFDGKSQGRLQIMLWTHLRRTSHFLALCLGLLGPSYKGAKFDKTVDNGVGGKLFVGGGEVSSEELMGDLEWGGEHSGLGPEGVVAGWRDAQKSNGALFCVLLGDVPFEFQCPFGRVESGLAILREAASHDPAKEVIIADIGVVLPKEEF